MIYTLTLNPSLDYILECRDIILGETNKAQKEKIFVGGKGINVSIVLKTLGFDSVALGFLAGFTGDEIKKRLDELNLQSDFIYLKNGSSRINIKLKNYSNLKASERLETEINASGPSPNQEEIQKLLEKLILLKDNDILILSGSVPPYNSNIYETIIEKTLSLNKKIKIVIDAAKTTLLNCLKYKPFLIKPNKKELEDLFNVSIDINEKNQIMDYAKKLKAMGAVNVLVSLGAEGAVLIDEFEREHFLSAPSGILVNSVGSGDSMVSGFLAGYLETQNYASALALSVAAGSASAFSPWLASKENIINMQRRL